MAIRFQYVQIRQVSFRLETIDENENEVAFEKMWKRGTSDSNTAIYINPNIKQESSDIVEIEKYRISGYQFHRYHLGEDRYFTHLLMIKPGEKAILKFNPEARCKTEAPDDLWTLLRQRRRWYLGTICNAIADIMTPKLWINFPLFLSASAFKLALNAFWMGVWLAMRGFLPLGLVIATAVPILVLYILSMHICIKE